MARTFIGELILRLKDEAGAQAQQTAAKIDGAVNKIEAAGRRLSAAPWGVGFQRQLDKIGASSSDIDRLRKSWDALYADMSGKNLSKALQKSELAGWKSATLTHFASQQAALREEMKKTEQHAKNWRNSMNNIFKAGLVTMGAYTGAYMGGVMIRGGATASSEWQREMFRQQMGNIPGPDKARLIQESERLGGIYPSVGITDIAELARNSRSLMGSTDSGIALLPDLVRGLVTLQSAQGVDVGSETLRNLLRGIDNLGQNGGPEGLAQTREILAGVIRASQVEGKDFDPGRLFEFARRAKIAGPGFSTEFLATTAPAIVQDMTASGAGTSFSTAFQAFVMGSNAATNKEQMANQFKFGIRNDDGLVNSKLFGQDPYRWAQEVLRPALIKNGVDITDPNAVAESVAGFTKAPMASYALTRMITQSDQIDRNRRLYANAMGPEAADQARDKDPFVAYRGFIESLNNLAAAVGEDVMPTIVAGLNSLANGVNALQQAWRDGDPMAKVGIAGAAVVGGASVWKITSAIWGLITAGTNLNAAAASLELAAISLGAPGGAGGKAGAAKGWGLMGLSFGSIASVLGLGALQSGSTRKMTEKEQQSVYQRVYEDAARKRYFENHRRPAADPYATLAGQRAASSGGNPLQDAVDNATRVGGQMKEVLSPTAKPIVDTSSIDAATAKAQTLVNTLRQAGEITTMMGGSINGTNQSKAVNRSLSDHGVTP